MSGLHIGSDFRKFAHGKLPPLAIIAICLLPLLFGGLFVWSYWDPLGNLYKLPVALVNSDEGENGQEVVDELLEQHPLDFKVVSAEEAKKGIADGTYYLGMEIPTDFSEAVTSVQDDDPHAAKINITLNETNGFIPTMLGDKAAEAITNAVSNSVGAKVVDQLFVGINTLSDGVHKAADGAEQLDEGANTAHDGSEKLNEGGTKLNGGIQQLNDKVQQLPDAVTKLDGGVTRLHDGAKQLNDGLGTASSGADQLSNGMVKLQEGTQQLGDGASQIAGGVDKIAGFAGKINELQAALDDINANLNNVIADLDRSPIPGSTQLADQARGVQLQLNAGPLQAVTQNDLVGQLMQLQAGAHKLATELSDPTAQYRSGVDQATAASKTLADGLKRLQDGSGTLLAGVTTLKDGTGKLVVAANTATDATSKLAAGSNQLVVGLGDLNDGLVKLSDGTGELSMSLADGAEKAPSWEGQRLDKAIDAAAEPVRTQHVGDGVTFFGKGLSPFFLSLSLWFGVLIMYMIMPPFSRRAIDSGTNPLRVLLYTMIPSFIIGFVQSVALWVMQVLILDVEPTHPLALFGVLVFVSWVFVAAILALNTALGPAPGRLATMALMSLQLVASNGLYPPEVQPRFIQWVHSWDPMRYSVDLMRYSLFGTLSYDPRMWTAITVLLFVGAASIAISCVALRARRVLRLQHLHPELTV
ncbi:YhgE/Pip domain-containing protein [Corynebacterium sp. zg912]|uniref:YhgE/Pip domain-containing protein n=1 Tax=Corynebacterium wankanglinii TaxID=2735136 RepID=A0A7H0KA53_9CORY|nr:MULTISPECIES: YhgE/Pip domain-containing protein [Corynebacterium]MBA1836505.1 YhgE/Pip domain-containing protein [Corynebacterium wankanglinii]MCR5928502.1 YhgE/Pip domain-containing protein [Corynebacterium sp. zg912]QNP94169.1 YhgE/Pip domain-containing protein [Corynebacterium wankanglinii]